MKYSCIVSLLLACNVYHCVLSYKPVVIIHGVWDVLDSLEFLSQKIKEAHPETPVYVLNVLHGWKSLAPLWTQVKLFYSHLLPILEEHPDEGINLIGYSQGGLIARGIIETYGANVSTFISLSSPQAGQYGDEFLHLIYPTLIKETVYEIFYSTLGQEVSIANYWNDPYHQKLYKKYCNYLPLINNQDNHTNSDFRDNFSKLQNLILIGGPDDEVITPWQSSHFSYYKENTEEVEDFKKRDIFLSNTFGLKSLYNSNRVKIYEISGVHHTSWHHNVTVINNCILPWLD